MANGEKTVNLSWHFLTGTEVCHKSPFQLIEGVNAPWLKLEVPCLSRFTKCGWKDDAEQDIRGTQNFHEGLVDL